jgi:tRNA pseudouridine(55) synthase
MTEQKHADKTSFKKEIVIQIYKKEGETPKQAISRFKKENPSYRNIPLTYAGRLDPMAEGVLLLLGGNAISNKKYFLDKDKVYQAHFLFGISTDSYDILGLIKKKNILSLTKNDRKNIEQKIKEQMKIKIQEYPPFSSKTINGHSMFEIAREGRKIKNPPKRKIEIKKINILGWYKVDVNKIINRLERVFKKLEGDFRQEKIIKSWKKINPRIKFLVLKLEYEVSSGTYIRGLADSLGNDLDIPTLAYRIIRTKLG